MFISVLSWGSSLASQWCSAFQTSPWRMLAYQSVLLQLSEWRELSTKFPLYWEEFSVCVLCVCLFVFCEGFCVGYLCVYFLVSSHIRFINSCEIPQMLPAVQILNYHCIHPQLLLTSSFPAAPITDFLFLLWGKYASASFWANVVICYQALKETLKNKKKKNTHKHLPTFKNKMQNNFLFSCW